MDNLNNCHSSKSKYTRYSSILAFRMLFIIIFIATMKVTYFCIPLLCILENKVSTAASLRSFVHADLKDSVDSQYPIKRNKPVMPIQELSIIGERNSGTRWTVRHLTECFNHSLYVCELLVRHKHWFQHDVPNGRKRVGTAVVAVF